MSMIIWVKAIEIAKTKHPRFRTEGGALRWAKFRESYRRIASESYLIDQNHQRSLAIIYIPP